MIKGSIQEETNTLVNIYEPNIGAFKYIKQILTDIKGEIEETLTPHSHQLTDLLDRKSIRQQRS